MADTSSAMTEGTSTMSDIGSIMTEAPSTIAVMEGLLGIARREYNASGRLSPDLLHAMYLVHGRSLVNALDLIDRKMVCVLRSDGGRWVYQVTGSRGTPYTCFHNSIFCQCPAFRFMVVQRRRSVVCKHVLAARLAAAMGDIHEKQVTDEHIRDLLAHLD